MVPYIPIPTVKGGPAELVKAYNKPIVEGGLCHREEDMANSYSVNVRSKITEKDIKVLEHLVLECDEATLLGHIAPSVVFDVRARKLFAVAIINYNVETRYRGFWRWKKPTYIKISGDAVKIEYDKGVAK